jgi:glycine cleavage system H protein
LFLDVAASAKCGFLFQALIFLAHGRTARGWTFALPNSRQQPQACSIGEEMAYPADLKYTKEHEWIKIEGNTGTIGITDHAQNSLGDIVFVELPKPGSELTLGQSFGTVESVKAVSDLYAPVSGTVTEVNSALSTEPEKVNSEPHSAWMIKVTLKDAGEASSLLSSSDYEKFIAEEQ